VSERALHVEHHGRGPALMLLHGYTGSARSMAGLAHAFGRDYQTLAPDLPGHGRSVAAACGDGYRFEGCLGDLAVALAASGHRRAHWLGYSMGARLALGCAVRYPEIVNSLVLVAGRAGIADPDERLARRRADDSLAVRIETLGVAAFVDEWLAQPLFATLHRRGPEFIANERRARLANDARGLAASLRALGPGAQPPLFDELPRVRVPVLLVAGALDERFVELARELARLLPQAELCVIPDAGHAVHVEQPAAFVRVASDFLRRAAGPAPSLPSRSVQETAT